MLSLQTALFDRFSPTFCVLCSGIRGGSNGGLLMGNMFVRRPDLFGAVCCAVPLLDMRAYHQLLAGASWMAEYGNPDVPEVLHLPVYFKETNKELLV